ncbi:hypothetical protein MSZK_01740 [Mycobacterium sp. shizuoka-1]|nr:hypothetical protein MSZK_01740 [Mycobacterium sp. shizuoka-1]
MDDELERELAAQRMAAAEREHDEDRESRAGLRRLEQFVQEMKLRNVAPFPIVEHAWVKRLIKGTPDRLFKKGTPDRYEEHQRWRVFDHGWTVGYPTHHESGPYGTYDGTAVTTNGVLLNASWTTPDARADTPEAAIITVDGRKYLLRGTPSVGAPQGRNFTPQHVAELIRHYVDGAH